ncbi:hypothetical protein HZS_7962, partial [Henneguya salminicola]
MYLKNCNISHKKIYKIQVFGTFFGNPLFPTLSASLCPYSNRFKITRSNNLLNFDVIVVHFVEYDYFVQQFLKLKIKEKKIIVVVAFESPLSISDRNIFFTKTQKKLYHWTCSYYSSSLLHEQYGKYIKSEKSYINDDKIKKEFSSRKNAALAIISNCKSNNTLRLDYIKELKKYFQVDTYGDCFSSKLSDMERLQKIKEYKFYLSFENAMCLEYATEKYWQAIKFGSIAVVMNYGNNTSHLIPDTFINVFDFESPKSLADYLN